MRTTYSVDSITGLFNGVIAGYTIPLAIVPADVGITGGEVVTNTSKNTTGAVTVVGTASVTTDVWFERGDFYIITLASNWIAQTADGVVIDVECKICGFSFPAEKLVDGICSVCLDDDHFS